jgi:peptidoglycan lytic transglycosylase
MTLLFALALVFATGVPSALRAAALPEAGFSSWMALGAPQFANDSTLAAVRRSDRSARDASGKLLQLAPAEHMRRASIYLANRAFDEAREHWQATIKYYPQDKNIPLALLGIGRSYFQERRYREAFAAFDQLSRDHPLTKEGREGLNFSAAALLRMGRPSQSVARYRDYIEKYPEGERIESAHLNVIDTLREADQSKEAIEWTVRTRARFAGTATETNALFARLRLDVAEGNWKHAILSAAELGRKGFQRGVLTTETEVAYLKGYSLERYGRLDEAFSTYFAIPDGLDSYYGWLATQRLKALATGSKGSLVGERVEQVNSQIFAAAESYPAPYRLTILKIARERNLDPRFILALIRQESVFRPLAKSPSGARGLLQLTIDAAQRYAPGAGLNDLREEELYRPQTSILIGSEYLAELSRTFPNRLEAVAASYNGGEDNVLRWVKRAKQDDPGVLTADIGFDETKAYVQKVMANYRVYQQLYTADLVRR